MTDPKQAIFRRAFRERAEAEERQQREREAAAVNRYRERLLRDGADPKTYRKLGMRLIDMGEDDQGIAALLEGIDRCPPSLDLYMACVRELQRRNRMGEAIATARRAAPWFPVAARLKEALLVPRFYESSAELAVYRERFAEGLDRFIGELKLDTPEAREGALEALFHHDNFYLTAQGRNDVHLRRKYGRMVHSVMAARYPEWCAPRPMPPLAAGEKIRVGCVSSCFCLNSVMKTHFGWIRHHDRDRFEVSCYYTGDAIDSYTEEARRYSRRFFHAPWDLEATSRAILADELHALVYLDVGLNGETTNLAALRLAPIQAATWGWPVTTGLPTMDYFLSGELMEPADGQAHYSERLVPLPGLGICYEKPTIPPLIWKTRSDFGIRDDAVAYLCCQAVHKCLPNFDAILTRIAARVKAAQFVFFTPNPALREALRRRLERAFSSAGLRADESCVFLPVQSTLDYTNLNHLCDVFLDTFEFSGCITTVEAVECRLPVVTCPGELMRGRQSFAILSQLGVTDGIAADADEYVEIAARLGLDRGLRMAVGERAANRLEPFYSDRRPVVALEKWLQDVVRARAS